MWSTAMIGISACSYGEGWTIMAACAPSKAPRWSSRTLPPPPSSAGVPSTVTLMPASSVIRARASPAPAAMAAITLCPQAWPTPGRASYSAHTTTCSGPDPARAANAVGRSPTPRSTSSPPPSSSSHSHAQARSSSNPSSGLAWIRWLRATSSSRACSTRSRAASLASATSGPPLLDQGLDPVQDPLQAEVEVEVAVVRLVEHPGRDHGVQGREPLGVGQPGQQPPVGGHHLSVRGGGAGRLGGGDVGLEHPLAPDEPGEQQHRRHLLGLAEAGVAQAAEAPLQPGHGVGSHRGAADGDAQHPGVAPVHRQLGPGPARQPVAPALLRPPWRRRRLEGQIGHQGQQLVLGAHIAVQRHGRHAEVGRDPAHRHRLEAVAGRDPHGRGHDPLQAEGGSRPLAGPRAHAPGRLDAGRQAGRSLVLHDLRFRGLTPILRLCIPYAIEYMAYTEGAAMPSELAVEAAGLEKSYGTLRVLDGVDLAVARVAGFDVLTGRRQVRRRISLTGQFAAVDDLQTGEENLRMLGRLAGLPGPVARRRGAELLERFDLTEAAR